MANCLRELGVKKGDAVTIYMPMVLSLGVACLACARIGVLSISWHAYIIIEQFCFVCIMYCVATN